MLISHTHKFIFFHVAKVAGLSIRAALKDYTQEPEKFKIRRPPQQLPNGDPNPLYTMWDAFLTHVPAKMAQKELGETYQAYYKFAFVRNPWDWQVSMYHFILKETGHVHHDLVKAMPDFETYLDWVIETPNPYARAKGATKFQKDMITDKEGNLIIDFIGKFEHLNTEFQQVCQHLQIEAQLPLINKSNHKHYQDYYTPSSRDKVADYFEPDITLLGYEYEE